MMHEPLIKERIEKAIQEGCTSQAVWREKRRRGTAGTLLARLFTRFHRKARKHDPAGAFLGEPTVMIK